MSRTGLVAIAIGVVVYAGVLALLAVGGLESADLAAYEVYLRDGSSNEFSDSPVVIAKLTDEDRRELGHWPVSDEKLSESIDRLTALDARVIGIDLARDLPVSPGSAELTSRLRSNTRVIGVRTFPGGLPTDVPPPPGLSGTDRVGFAEMIADPDGKVRRALLFQGDENGYVEYAFALRLALSYLRAQGVELSNDPRLPELVRLGPTTIPRLGRDAGGYVATDAGGYQFLIDFGRATGGFDSVQLTQLLRGEVEAERIRDRLVIIGATAAGAHDVFDVPIPSSLPAGSGVAGVELHAHITDQLLRFGLGQSRGIRVLPDWLEALGIGVLVGLGLALGTLVRGAWLFAILLVVGLGLLWLGGLWVFRVGWWVPVAGPAVAFVTSAFAVTAWMSSRERAERALLMQLFSRHVSSSIADEIWAHRTEFLRGGRPKPERLACSVLFLDIKDSTSPTEKLSPERLMEWANHFMDVMARTVAEHGGVVDDYFGDGLKANFGVPFPRDSEAKIADDARHAVTCALALGDELTDLNAGYREDGLPTVAMRVGIHTGPVVAGSLGSEDRLKYTTLGDVVVTASRLGDFDEASHDFRAHPCQILIGEQTLGYLEGGFRTEPLGVFALKGKGERVSIHRVLGVDPPGQAERAAEGASGEISEV